MDMQTVDSYFSVTKHKLDIGNYSHLTIVLGNESCDLDSAACSIVLSRFLAWQHSHSNMPDDNLIYLPVLNVDREDYELKTEILYSFSKMGLTANDLVFRNDYDLSVVIARNPTTVILVDHHILSEPHRFLMPNVTEIIDHRPVDEKVREYNSDVKLNIELVGSCATLVAQRCIESTIDGAFFKEFPKYADLLHSTIILDTANFSELVKKGTPRDLEIVELLEALLHVTDPNTFRCAKLSELTRAKSDVLNLTAAQLLRKDAKVKGSVFMPGFPILVEEFLRKPNAIQSLEEALKSNKCSYCLLLGLKTEGETPERDIAVYNVDNDAVAQQLSKHLQDWKETNFQLKPTKIEGVTENFDYFKQMNLCASRKQYMPAVEAFLSKF